MLRRDGVCRIRHQVARPCGRGQRDRELDASRELEVRACPAGARRVHSLYGRPFSRLLCCHFFSFVFCDDAGGEFRDTLCRRIGESPVLTLFEWMCKCVQLVEERLAR